MRREAVFGSLSQHLCTQWQVEAEEQQKRLARFFLQNHRIDEAEKSRLELDRKLIPILERTQERSGRGTRAWSEASKLGESEELGTLKSQLWFSRVPLGLAGVKQWVQGQEEAINKIGSKRAIKRLCGGC